MAEDWSHAAPEARVMERQSLFAPRPGFAAPPPLARAEAAFAPPPEVRQYPMGVARGQVAKTYIVAEAED
ncbi:hypothetical protein LLE87_38820, partial [Paenibacillus polymyxa]|nr:hypothetical protein [Paenibacillus polymyxa]